MSHTVYKQKVCSQDKYENCSIPDTLDTASAISHLKTWHWNMADSCESPCDQVKAKQLASEVSIEPRA